MIVKECVRLAAKITDRQCEINRSRVDDLTKNTWAVKQCVGCPGLDPAPVVLEPLQNIPRNISDEGFPMANVRCVVEGCGKFHVIGDRCTKHAREIGREKAPPLQDPEAKRQMLAKAAKQASMPKSTKPQKKVKLSSNADLRAADRETVCAACGVHPCVCKILAGPSQIVGAGVACSEVTLCDMGLELSELFNARRLSFLQKLMDQKTVKDRARVFVAMVDMVEGLAC